MTTLPSVTRTTLSRWWFENTNTHNKRARRTVHHLGDVQQVVSRTTATSHNLLFSTHAHQLAALAAGLEQRATLLGQ